MVRGTSQRGGKPAANEVHLVGRVSREPVRRQLPSGDEVVTFRVIVPRTPGSGSVREARGVDALECAAWTPRARRSAQRFAPGDIVEVHGAVRRRFFRRGPTVESMVEIEVAKARLIRRAPTA